MDLIKMDYLKIKDLSEAELLRKPKKELIDLIYQQAADLIETETIDMSEDDFIAMPKQELVDLIYQQIEDLIQAKEELAEMVKAEKD